MRNLEWELQAEAAEYAPAFPAVLKDAIVRGVIIARFTAGNPQPTASQMRWSRGRHDQACDTNQIMRGTHQLTLPAT